MRNCIPKNTGAWGQTSTESSIEITLGKTYYQQGLAATCKDCVYKAERWRRAEIIGLAHKFVVAINTG